MNVASLDLCQQLDELSGWDNTVWYHWKGTLYTSHEINGQTMSEDNHPVPAYDLGYLLRKLPRRLESSHGTPIDLHLHFNEARWIAWYTDGDFVVMEADLVGYAGTPEDAAAKLAIALFKQGILTPAGQS